jgi:hypothetical protein
MNPEKVRALLAKHSAPKLTPAAHRLIAQASAPAPHTAPRPGTKLPPQDYTRRKPLTRLHHHCPGFGHPSFLHHD